MKKYIAVAALLSSVVIAGGAANASSLCQAHDQSHWMSKEAITQKLVAMGYEVRKVQPEDGCWELKGTKDGKRVEAYFDPVTAELVLTK